MKKSIFSALCFVLLATTTQSAWGATETLTFSNVGKDLPSTANTTVSTTTVNSYTFNYYQCKKQTSGSNYYAFLTKSVSPYFGNATAIPGTITSVSVTIPSGASKSTTYTIGFSTTPITSADACTTTLGKGNNTTFTANNSVSGATYFAISLGNANNGQISSITVTYESQQTTVYLGLFLAAFVAVRACVRRVECLYATFHHIIMSKIDFRSVHFAKALFFLFSVHFFCLAKRNEPKKSQDCGGCVAKNLSFRCRLNRTRCARTAI